MERDEDMIFSVPIDHHEVERLRKEEGDGFAVGNYVILSNGGPAKIVEVRHATNFLARTNSSTQAVSGRRSAD